MNTELMNEVLEFLVSIENDLGVIPQFMMEWRDSLVSKLNAELSQDNPQTEAH